MTLSAFSRASEQSPQKWLARGGWPVDGESKRPSLVAFPTESSGGHAADEALWESRRSGFDEGAARRPVQGEGETGKRQ